MPAASITGRLTTLVEVTIPAVQALVDEVEESATTAVADANERIASARADLSSEIMRAQGAEETLHERISTIQASAGGYDDGPVYARIQTVDTARADDKRAIGQRIDSVEAKTNATDARLTTEAAALAGADRAIADRTSVTEAKLAGETDSPVLARVRATETALADGRFAAASRVGVLEAQVGGTNGLTARIASTETAVTDGRFAAASRVGVLEAQVGGTGGLTARIATTETAVTDGRFAAASRVGVLEAQIGGTNGLTARIASTETAVSDGRFAAAQTLQTLRAAYDGTVAEVSDQRGVLNGLNGKTAAYVRIMAATPGGRAALSLWSDEYGGAWSLTGDGQIDGNLTVNGTISARAFNRDSVSRYGQSTWSGSMTPGAGSRVPVPWSISLPTIPSQGRFIYEFRAVVTSNVGQRQTQTLNGRPYYIDYVEAGGGLEVICLDPQRNGYRPRANGSDPVLATVDFAPLFQASIGNGNYDTGVMNEGDYYRREVAATFTLSLIDLRLTWIAV